MHFYAGGEALGQVLKFKQASLFRENHGDEMRRLMIAVNLVSDFEEAERIEVAGVVGDVFQDAGQQAGA